MTNDTRRTAQDERKKPYVKPTVSAPQHPPKGGNPITREQFIQMDGDVIRMLTKQGFADLFWERLQEERKTDTCISQEAVFNALNEKYLKAIGCTRYSCFDSFRIVRDKKVTKPK